MQLLDDVLSIRKILDVNKATPHMVKTTKIRRPTDCFLYVLSGYAYYTLHGKTTKIEKGNVIFFSRIDTYSVEIPPSGFTMIYVDFFLEDTKEPLRSEIFTPQNSSVIESSFEKLHKLWETGNFSEKIYCNSLMYRIYSDLARHMQYKYTTSDQKNRIEAAIQFLIQNFSNSSFSVEQLGPMCQMSQGHFRRIFSQIYHTTPVAFLTTLRINAAKELLHADSLSIVEIAAQCGFNSASYFTKKFREETGLTPTEYKKY